MNFNLSEDILGNMPGFHIYDLSHNGCVCFAGSSLCDMTGYLPEELADRHNNLYEDIVYEPDKKIYGDFIRELTESDKKLETEYRIIRKDKKIIYVKDISVPRRQDDGSYTAYSVLTDITSLKKDDENRAFLNESIPCGFLRYTCEKQPKVTYINKRMLEFLRFPEKKDGELDYFEMYKDNIFLMVPAEERRRFSLYLNRVYSAGVPMAGEISLTRCDGTVAHFFGWVTKGTNEDGVEEFQSVCMDITQRYQKRKDKEAKRYIKALSDVYDKIFEYNLGNNTVRCLYSNNSAMFRWLENLSVQMEDATEKWISETVDESDKERVSTFFDDFIKGRLEKEDEKPKVVSYKALSSDGELKRYNGTFIRIDTDTSLYCCRQVPEDTESIKNENIQLRENMQEIMERFTDGVAAFKVTSDGYVMPLYSSDNVCGFFGYTLQEWNDIMKDGSSIEDFVAHCDTDYERFEKLLKDGEAEFTYKDLQTGREKRIKAICSQKNLDVHSSRYVMLYTVNEKLQNDRRNNCDCKVMIRTFGYFDVFVEDKPIAFRNKKSKELLALLVDRRGGYVTSDEAISFLWEDETVNPVTLARYRKVALRLKNILEEYGIADVVESVDGKRRIVQGKVKCDLYDYLSGNEEYSQLFKGSYLNNYSWAETTLGELCNEKYM